MVTTASTGCSRRYFERKRTDGRTHDTLGSGTKRLPLSHREMRFLRDFFCELRGFTSAPVLEPVRRRYSPYGSQMRVFMISALSGMSASRLSSTARRSGFSGV